MQGYDFSKIEKKWQKEWLKKKTYEPNLKGKPVSGRRPFYNLMMFPYPSAEGLHVGNAYAFIGSDIYGRFQRMKNNDVFEPIGLDGFGIHSENYALKIGAHPMKQAKVSEKRFYKQLVTLGNGFSWDERLETYDPEYYKWTQWIFTQLFKKGLAYRKKQPVNWCPSCKTVLADEQVIQKRQATRDMGQGNTTGVCERCDTKVIKKELEQWFFKITDYADRLLKNIDGLDWSEKVKIAQRNWIGKSEGAELDFEVKTKEKPNFVILYGYQGSPKAAQYQWLKKEIEKRGYKVTIPVLPNTESPDEKEQAEYVLKHVKFERNTVLYGKSFGSVVAMKVLEQLKKPVSGLVIAGGFLTREGLYKPNTNVKFSGKYNFAKIRRNTGFIKILSDLNDKKAVLPSAGKELQKKLGGELIEVHALKDHFGADNEPSLIETLIPKIKVFTTRPDTLFGATYLVLAPEHRWLEQEIRNPKSEILNKSEIQKYINKAKKKTEEERLADDNDPSTGSGRGKTGVELKGIKAINPANGKEIPVWVADYVLTGYGTGAIMAVPAHDERDFKFAKKYKLPIEPVVLKQNEASKSFVMGVSEKDMESFGAKIVEKTDRGFFKILIPFEKITEYKTFIRKHMQVGYWNEFSLPKGFYFIFKHKNGHIEEIELNEKTNDLIDNYGMTFNGKKPNNVAQNVYGWLAKNSFYEDLLIHTESGVLISSDKFNGMESEKAKWEMTKFVGGKRKTQFRLRDWLISRQRYWGPPIPVIYCDKCPEIRNPKSEVLNKSKILNDKYQTTVINGKTYAIHAVPEDKLPVKLPFVKNFQPKGTGKSPLATVKSFYETKCPKCGGKARRETDVSDTFLDSAWYFLRYPSIKIRNPKSEIRNKSKIRNSKAEVPWDREITQRWLPVNMYIGGVEHSVLHLLYSRFMTMALHDIGILDFPARGGSASGGDEPFSKFRAHGLLIKEGAKMSKSKGNVVNPDEYIKNFGADTLRMYLMFLAPFEYGGDFRDAGIMGIKRFLERVWKLYSDKRQETRDKDKLAELERATHYTIKKVTEDIESLRYNTAISALMILLNKIEEVNPPLSHVSCLIFLKLLAPFAPHIAEELRQIADSKSQSAKKRFKSIHNEKWPEYDEKLIRAETFTLIIQVNGKVRDTVEVPAGMGRAEAEKLALGREKIENIVKLSAVKKVIYVPGRLINIVV